MPNPIGIIHDKNINLWQCPLCDAYLKYIDRYAHLFLEHRQWFEASNYMGKKPILQAVIPIDDETYAPLRDWQKNIRINWRNL